MSTSAQRREHAAPDSRVQALLYHANQVGEIARFLDSRDPEPHPSAVGAEGAGTTINQLIQQVRRRLVTSRISLDVALAEVPSDPSEVLHSLLLKNPGRTHLLVSRSLMDGDADPGRVSAHADGGTVVRVAGQTMPRMALIDGTVAVLGESSARLTVIRDRAVVRALEALFDTAWEGAADSGVLSGTGAGLLRDIEEGGQLARVLHLLGSGLTDTAAARELGWSVRTYRRYVADLMTRLQARSRFQAGMLTAQLRLEPRTD